MADSVRWILSGAMTPVDNMALDEALLTLAQAPTLRLYRWNPHGVSLGYFQTWREFPWDRFASEGVPVVRRLTGGGAIFHGDEITFSIVASSQHPIFGGTVRESYDRVHASLARALAACCPDSVKIVQRGAAQLASDVKGSPWCFHESTEFDLTASGRKLAGSAQRRTGGRVLHHGSLVLRSNRYTPEVASLASLGGDADPERLEGAVAEAFARDWKVSLDKCQPTAEEATLARELAATRYGTDAWTRRR